MRLNYIQDMLDKIQSLDKIHQVGKKQPDSNRKQFNKEMKRSLQKGGKEKLGLLSSKEGREKEKFPQKNKKVDKKDKRNKIYKADDKRAERKEEKGKGHLFDIRV